MVIRPLYYKLTGKELEQKKVEAKSVKEEPSGPGDAKTDETTLRYKNNVLMYFVLQSFL